MDNKDNIIFVTTNIQTVGKDFWTHKSIWLGYFSTTLLQFTKIPVKGTNIVRMRLKGIIKNRVRLLWNLSIPETFSFRKRERR